MKKVLGYTFVTVMLFGLLGIMCLKYVVPDEYPVFIESFSHGVMTVDNVDTRGSDSKFRIMCRKGESLTININPERTDKAYYNLSMLVVNGEDVTDEVDMLQYKTKVSGKLTVLAYFKKGKAPSASSENKELDFDTPPVFSDPADNPYLGSRLACDISDPSIIFDSLSGYYYCFASDNVVIRSKDLINWTDRMNYFHPDSESPDTGSIDFDQFACVKNWAKTHGYKTGDYSDSALRNPVAPDIVKIGSTYYLYFSILKQADYSESAIFCVKTDNLSYSVENKKWTEVGMIVNSCGNKDIFDPAVATHPSVLSVSDKLYMAYGAYSKTDTLNGGIYLLELDPSTGLLKNSSQINATGEEISTRHGQERYKTGVLISRPGSVPSLDRKQGSLVSAADLIYNSENGYYYLFVTYGTQQSNYSIRAARSKSVAGPYIDSNGTDMTEFLSSGKKNQYSAGNTLIAGYNFTMSSGGGVSYTDVGKASIGSPCIIKENGKWLMATQAQLYYKSGEIITTGDALAQENQLDIDTSPALDIRQIFFSEDEWPLAVCEPYAGEKALKSVKAADMYGNWDVVVLNSRPENIDAVERNESQMVSIFKGVALSTTNMQKGTKLKKLRFEKNTDLSYTILLDGTQYTIYPLIAWDNELDCPSLTFSGISADGTAVWGKKNISPFMGIYSDTFYYLLNLTDNQTQEKYTEKINKISANPTQEQIDKMTKELLSLLMD